MVTVDELLAQISTLQSQLKELEKKDNKFRFFKLSNRLVIEIAILCILIQIYYWPLKILTIFLEVSDVYAKLLITSWPAVILIISLFILVKYKETLNYLLTKRNIDIKGFKITGAKLEEQQKLGAREIEEKATGGTGMPMTPPADSLDKDKTIEELKKNNESLKALAKKTIREKTFERIYNIIFGSQIKILLEMTKKDGTLLVSGAFKFYIEGIGGNPELKDYDFIKYLDFLKNVGLIEFTGLIENADTISITEQGKEFLAYLAIEKLNMNKPL